MASRYHEIYDHLSAQLKSLAPTDAVIKPETKLVDDLGLDSVQVMEVLMDLEDTLDTTIPLNFLPEVETMDDLVKALDRSMTQGPA